MRSTRTLGLAAGAIVVALALIGASAASAANTQLCSTHGTLTCSSPAEEVTMTNVGVGLLLNSLADVLCLTFGGEGEALALANPQQIHVTELAFEECGTAGSHNNCAVTVNQLPLANLNKTGLDLGTLTGTNGKTFVNCTDVVGSLDIECEYDATGLALAVGAQHLTADDTAVKEIGSDFLCPNNPTLDGLLTTEEPASATVLCKTHAEPCAEKNQVKSIDVTTTKAPVLYNTVANVECESSLTAATVLSPAEPQKLDVTELKWNECHTQGAAENCTVTTSGLPTIDLDATALNLGSAETLGLEIEVDCIILDLIELDCIFDSDVTLQVEGALHKESSGHGRFVAAKTVLDLTEGGEHCPDEVKWDASYEASEHLYVVTSSSKSKSNAYILA